MSALLVYLPATAAGATTEYRYALSRDGQTVAQQGRAVAQALPFSGVGQDVVAVVPGRCLSWHRLELPKGSLAAGPARLRAVLDGMLEDKLLDDCAQFHFAVEPRPGATVHIAACDKAWLQAVLAPLEAAARPVSRIVPEFAPIAAGAAKDAPAEVAEDTLYAVGESNDAWLVHPQAQGVMILPLQPTVAQAWLAAGGGLPQRTVRVLAEPSVAALANNLFQTECTLLQAPQRWLLALDSDWDLAQFDLANSGRQRAWRKFMGVGFDLAQAPRWRAARWGAVALVLTHLVGLNAWAWRESAELAAKRNAVQQVLTQTFPQVKVVIDAPVQMSREVAQLRQATGAAVRQDLENLLTALGSVAAPQSGSDLSQLDYTNGELRLKGSLARAGLTSDQLSRLKAQGFAVRPEGEGLLLSADSGQEARP